MYSFKDFPTNANAAKRYIKHGLMIINHLEKALDALYAAKAPNSDINTIEDIIMGIEIDIRDAAQDFGIRI